MINVDGVGRLGEAVAIEAGGPAHGLLAALDQAGRHVGLPLATSPVASDNRRYAADRNDEQEGRAARERTADLALGADERIADRAVVATRRDPSVYGRRS